MERHGDLDIRHDLNFHRRLFAVQRVGWVVLTLFILAALLGLIGAEGPLNEGITENDRLRVEFERFLHQESPTRIQVIFRDPRGQRVELWVSAGYLNQVRLQNVSPQPQEVIASHDQFRYVFKTTQPGEPLTVAMLFTPTSAGYLRGQLQAGNDNAPLNFSQFVYP
jgi:protein-L-isoaspartate(D-aspartate) O-methyltransferase